VLAVVALFAKHLIMDGTLCGCYVDDCGQGVGGSGGVSGVGSEGAKNVLLPFLLTRS
jgi:hypothetical protein